MKKSFFLIIFFLIAFFLAKASPTDSISTIYQDSEFITKSQVWVNASDSIANTIINDFSNQICYTLDPLFGWALKGMNLRKEKNELIMFYFKSTSFDNKTNVIHCLGDVIVPGVLTLPDISFYCKVTPKVFQNGNRNITVDLLRSSGFIKKMKSSFSVIHGKGKEKGVWFTFETRTSFGWFFNIFITQSRYKSTMEWRINQYMHNMKDEAEQREKKSIRTYKSMTKQ